MYQGPSSSNQHYTTKLNFKTELFLGTLLYFSFGGTTYHCNQDTGSMGRTILVTPESQAVKEGKSYGLILAELWTNFDTSDSPFIYFELWTNSDTSDLPFIYFFILFLLNVSK